MEFSDVIWKFVEQFILALIPLIVPLLGAWLLPKAINAWKELKLKSGIDPALIDAIAKMAVQAAEQAGLNGWAEDKKAWAIDKAVEFLKSKGIKIDLAILDTAIESAVMELFNNKVE